VIWVEADQCGGG